MEKKPNLKKFKNKSLTKAKLLYVYILAAGVVSFIYTLSCPFTKLSYWYAVIPYSVLILYFIGIFLYKNWKMIWVFIESTNRGQLLLFLLEFDNKNKNSPPIWDFKQKLELIEWVYPRSNVVRKERWVELSNKIYEKIPLTSYEKKEYNRKVVRCPQQLLLSFNAAILANALIHSHRNIQVLDDELRSILNLTDEYMDSFNLQDEINKCTPKSKK
ncbi:MAG: hypothetical protein LLF95_11280 [Bacteroidales bacterium]|nr:hypothetical protein [Bacteroidales bacterium]